MVFASQGFLLFLVVLLALYAVVTARNSRAGRPLLIAASFFFYGYWRPSYLGILIFSICANYLLGGAVRRVGRTTTGAVLTTLGVAGNLLLIGYYKYFEFLLESLNRFGQQSFDIPDILLPIGISFFTFQQVSFLVDEYQRKAGRVRFWDYVLFISFFPQLIAGPIVRHSDMIWQLAQKTDWRLKSWQLALGLSLFAMGLFKKSVLIDPQVPHIDVIFDQAAAGIPVSAFDGWVAALGYGFQIYFDFSAYSDMAIGLGFMFGLRLPVNFFSPYKADSFRDFWRRWHITLSRFLRDYLYIPLGGSWHGFPRTILALLVTMGLGGLWHGAGWTFVIWGLIHGVLLGVNHVWDKAVRPRIPFLAQPRSPLAARIGRWASVLVVYTVVNVAWVYFRATDVAAAHVILAGMFGVTDAPSISEMDGIAQMLPYYLAIVWLLPNTMQMFRRFEIALNADDYFDRARPLVLDRLWAVRLGVRWAVISAIVFAVDWSFLSDMSPFIYFQF